MAEVDSYPPVSTVVCCLVVPPFFVTVLLSVSENGRATLRSCSLDFSYLSQKVLFDGSLKVL